jgi:hypothetical protein
VTVLVDVGEDGAVDRARGGRHKKDQLSGQTEDERSNDQHECGREHWEGPTSRRVGSSASDSRDGDDGGGRRGGVERCERHVAVRHIVARAVTIEQRDGLVKVDSNGIATAVDAAADKRRSDWGKIWAADARVLIWIGAFELVRDGIEATEACSPTATQAGVACLAGYAERLRGGGVMGEEQKEPGEKYSGDDRFICAPSHMEI